MTVKTNIAAGLKAARKSAGMNVDEVGAALGKSGKTISAWEVGRGQPDADELIMLCRLLGVHLRDFYGEEYKELISDDNLAVDLSEEEIALIRNYRKCNDGVRSAIRSLAASMANIPDEATMAYNAAISEQEKEYYNEMLEYERGEIGD